MTPAATNADIIRSWFNDSFSSGPVARDTEAHNQVFAAVADLAVRLAPAPAPAIAPEPSPAVKGARAPKTAAESPTSEPEAASEPQPQG